MKRKIGIIAMATIMAITGVSLAAPKLLQSIYQGDFYYLINGKMKALPQGYSSIVYDGRNYVPIRFVSEALGADVIYNPSTKVIEINSSQNPGINSSSNDREIMGLRRDRSDLESQVAELNRDKASLMAQIDDYRKVLGMVSVGSNLYNGYAKDGFYYFNGQWYRQKGADGRYYDPLIGSIKPNSIHNPYPSLPVAYDSGTAKLHIYGDGDTRYNKGVSRVSFRIVNTSPTDKREYFTVVPQQTELVVGNKVYYPDGNSNFSAFNQELGIGDNAAGTLNFSGIDFPHDGNFVLKVYYKIAGSDALSGISQGFHIGY